MDNVYKVAESYIGLQEWSGARHNPEILGFFEDSGHGWVKDDETPWCAAFVGAVLAEAGETGTGKLNARSYSDWGVAVEHDDIQKGDVVVLWRESPSSWKGHVAFAASGIKDDGTIDLLGGNQGNAVSVQAYPASRIVAVRRAKKKRQSVAQTRTAQASATTIVSGAATGVTAIAALDGTAQLAMVGLAAVIMIAGLIIFRDRIKAFAAGWK